jgi:leader peptidase (prepilin peptidase)/N-methyltransferase
VSGAVWWIASWGAAGLPLGVLVRAAIRRLATNDQSDVPCPDRGAGVRYTDALEPVSTGRPACAIRRSAPAPLLAEVLTGAAFALSAWIAALEGGPVGARTLRAAGLCWLAAFALAAVWIDALVQRLPDRLVLPAGAGVILLCCAAAFCDGRPTVAGRVVLAATLAAAVFLLLALLVGIGLGDVKLAGALGAALGYASWSAAWRGAVLAFALAGCFTALRLMAGRMHRGEQLALGPYLYLGSMLALTLR